MMPANSPREAVPKNQSRLYRLGQLGLPDPFTLFVVASVVLIALSSVAASRYAVALHPITGVPIAVTNLATAATLKRFLTELPAVVVGFPPLATVLVAMLGIGVAERSGLLSAALKAAIKTRTGTGLTTMVVFGGIMSSIAAETGYVVLIPLAASLFLAVGRHPIAGVAAAFAAVSGAYGANLLVTPLDALLAGITEAAAQMIAPGTQVQVSGNYFLNAALVPFFTVAGVLVTERIIEPRLGAYGGTAPQQEATPAADERRALGWSGVVFAAAIGIVLLASLPSDGFFRAADGGLSPLYDSLVVITSITFLIAGTVFGVCTGAVRSDKDVVAYATDTISALGYYIVLVFPMAVFLALFAWSNLGGYTAVVSAEWLRSSGMVGIPLVLAIILLTASANMLVGSASAKWALMAPIFVPSMALLGYTPEFTQAVYRVGDTFTNIITPLNPYFPLTLMIARRYVPDFGVGRLLSLMLPYALAFAVASIVPTLLWTLADWPIGPGVEIRIEPAMGPRN